jgi:hypothetical protein
MLRSFVHLVLMLSAIFPQLELQGGFWWPRKVQCSLRWRSSEIVLPYQLSLPRLILMTHGSSPWSMAPVMTLESGLC